MSGVDSWFALSQQKQMIQLSSFHVSLQTCLFFFEQACTFWDISSNRFPFQALANNEEDLEVHGSQVPIQEAPVRLLQITAGAALLWEMRIGARRPRACELHEVHKQITSSCKGCEEVANNSIGQRRMQPCKTICASISKKLCQDQIAMMRLPRKRHSNEFCWQ